MNTKWSLHFRTEWCGAVYRERPGNRLTHSLRKKKVMNARHERHTARIAPKPRRLLPEDVPLSTFLLLERLCERCTCIRRDMSENRQNPPIKYTCAYIVSVLCPVLQVFVFCSRRGLRVACRAGSTAVLQSISEWVSCSAGRCLLHTCCSTVLLTLHMAVFCSATRSDFSCGS